MRSACRLWARGAGLKGVAAAEVWALPALVWAQAVPVPSSAAGGAQPFAGIGASLTMRADALLANGGQPAAPAVLIAPVLVPAREPWPVPLQTASAGPALARVEMLRPAMDPILQREGVPTELAAVVLVESGGNTRALSAKGARGLWQLMPDTARRYGLVVDGATDERVDIEKSTRAAARYLSDLRLQFGSWPLALAAYNTGEQNLQRAIEQSRSSEFAVLSANGRLPLETRNYVPAVLAASRAFGQPFAFQTQPVPSSAITVFAASTR